MKDFGFTFEGDSEEIKLEAQKTQEAADATTKEMQSEIDRLKENNRKMFSKIVVLLNNLKQSPEKPVINWPNRGPAIDEFIKELEELRK